MGNPKNESWFFSKLPSKHLKIGEGTSRWYGATLRSISWKSENPGQSQFLAQGIGLISSLGLQIAQSRYYSQTLDPKVGTICILGALGVWNAELGEVRKLPANKI